MRRLVLAGWGVSVLLVSCLSGQRKPEGIATTHPRRPPSAEETLQAFIERHVARLAPLEKANNLANWEASTSGSPTAFERMQELELAIRKLYADPQAFAALKRLQASGKVKDPLLARQLTILLLDFQENQLAEPLLAQMVALSTEIQRRISGYRGTLEGRPVSDNDLLQILRTEKDEDLRRRAWEAYMAKGEQVRRPLVQLVKLRNRAARQLGFTDFYQMQLRLTEQDSPALQALLEEVATRTDEPFSRLLQPQLLATAQRFQVRVEDLRPWHFSDPFFQEAPLRGDASLEGFFAARDPVEVVTRFFLGIGLPVGEVLARSDLYEKRGKLSHAFCTDIDRQGDVRILANLRPSQKWTTTLMHEAGHASYDQNIDPGLPWLLRESAHGLVTEAVAQLFGDLTRDPGWIATLLEPPPQALAPLLAELRLQARLDELVFVRWTLVLVNFERELYRDPDQDLDGLWWRLKKRYQQQETPPGWRNADWAAKVHLSLWPASYHNYLLGRILASQLRHVLAAQVLATPAPFTLTLTGKPVVGRFLREQLFAPGKSLGWEALLVQVTGEKLNPRYFLDELAR
jgi:peptidyl-dipeptidase A